MPDPKDVTVLDAERIDRTISRIAHEIVERHRDLEKLCLVGIRTRGVPLAHRLKKALATIADSDVPVGILDITLYRDDLNIRVGIFTDRHTRRHAIAVIDSYDSAR